MSKVVEKELKFGEVEWMEELDKRVNFPSMFAVYYGIDRTTEERYLHVLRINTKSTEPSNIKYGSVLPTLSMVLVDVNWLLEGVYYIESVEEYKQRIEKTATRLGVTM